MVASACGVCECGMGMGDDLATNAVCDKQLTCPVECGYDLCTEMDGVAMCSGGDASFTIRCAHLDLVFAQTSACPDPVVGSCTCKNPDMVYTENEGCDCAPGVPKGVVNGVDVCSCPGL
jgi:hypothetical protein